MSRSFAFLALIAAAACKSDPGAPPEPASIALVRGDNQLGVSGKPVADSIKFRVLTVDRTPAGGVTVTFTVTQGGGSLASTTAITDGSGEVKLPVWTLGADEGDNRVQASAGAAINASVRAVAVLSLYNIDIQYVAEPTATQRAAFDEARRRWRSIIQGDLTDVQLTINPGDCSSAPAFNGTVDDVIIFVDLVDIDGPGKVLGSAGPCFIRSPGNQLTVAGIMRFDKADLDTLESRGQLNNVILHEVGHVLGFGSLWNRKNLLDTTSVSGDPIFTGVNAGTAFTSAGGSGRPVPVENSFGPGTRLAHWREATLTRELMTGFLNTAGTGMNPLSAISIASMRDMGYTVDMTKAEAFSLTAALRAESDFQTPSSTEGIELLELELATPIRAIDQRGRVTAIYPRSSRKQ